MVDSPVVLIASEGKVSPLEIIHKLRDVDEANDKVSLDVGTPHNYNAYKFCLTTKYYTTNLLLVPIETELDLLPPTIMEKVEALLIYFDSGNRGFSKRLKFYVDFVETHKIELAIMLCSRLYDDSNEGITYKEAKQGSNLLFDVIELERSRGEDEEDDPNDPLGYDELLQALKSFVWSNIDVDAIASRGTTSDSIETYSNAELTSYESSIETELDEFESLLSQVHSFRAQTANWPRELMLDHAGKLAEDFARIMDKNVLEEDEDDDDAASNDFDLARK